jgi:regulator of CtrA degradation
MTDHTAPESIGQGATVRDFASSEMFERTFAEGMQLVEETAAYLDGVGRKESKLLSRNAALVYAGESMRLTTRLMQIASWLLVQRAVREGDMAATEASQERYRIRESEEHRGRARAGSGWPA